MKKNSIKVFLLLAFTNWVSHFLYFKRFGLYEDDYANLPNRFGISFLEVKNFILYYLKTWPQGRPLLFIPGLFAFAGHEISEGLYMLYVIGFLIVLVNAFLIYKILRKIFPESELFAISGALAFCLFPPDTIKLYLLVVYQIQIALMFFFVATLLYLNGWKKLSYLVAFMCLCTYESTFIVFFAVPLLKGKWDKIFRKEMITHIIVMFSMIAVAYLVRKMSGETRVMQATSDLLGTSYKTLMAMIIGPLFSLFLFYRAPVVTLIYWIQENHNLYWWYYNYIFYFVGVAFLLFIFYFRKIRSDYFPKREINSQIPDLLVHDENNYVKDYLQKLIKISLTAVIMLCLAYALSFSHYPPTAIRGSVTSVHLAANIGGSILFACICTSIFFIAERYKLKKYAIFILSLYLALLVGYNTYAQKEFVISWQYQKTFWTKILELVPDLNENTVIIVDGNYSPTKYIYSHHLYNDMIIFNRLFKFPGEWKSHPMLFVVHDHHNWKKSLIQMRNNELFFKSPLLTNYVPLKDSNVVIVTANKKNELIRIDSTVTLLGTKLNLKPKSEPTIDYFKKNKLYDYLINSNK